MILLALPEIIVGLTALLVLLIDITAKSDSSQAAAKISLAGLFGALLALAAVWPHSGELAGGAFAVGAAGGWFKAVFLLAGAGTIALSYGTGEKSKFGSGCEYLFLLLLTLLGMMLLVSSRDMITIYVSLELATIPLFLLAAWSTTTASSEAGMKYVILGAVSSALLLFGMSIIYGVTGEMSVAAIAAAFSPSAPFWYGLALIGAGIGFKLALVPFQMWAPDVYEGAPTAITAYLSVASKAAGVALAVVLFAGILRGHLAEISPMIALISAVTMTLGNLAAMAQKNMKRFMAYSSISQAGYILMGFIGAFSEGPPAVIFYLLCYVVTNFAVFAVIALYQARTGRQQITDYAGLSQTHPLLALVMMIGLFSLAGIPPLAGFTGKFFLFSIAAQAGFYWLVTLAALNSTVSLYYYLKIVRQMYIEPPVNEPQFTTGSAMSWTLGLTFAATILIGVLPIFYESISAQTLGGF